MVMAFACEGWGATKTASQSGDWSDRSTWGTTKPNSTSVVVVINEDVEVTISDGDAFSCGKITINGSLILDGDLEVHGDFVLNGEISGEGNLIFAGDDTQSITGEDLEFSNIEIANESTYEDAGEEAGVFLDVNLSTENLTMTSGYIITQGNSLNVSNLLTVSADDCYIDGKFTCAVTSARTSVLPTGAAGVARHASLKVNKKGTLTVSYSDSKCGQGENNGLLFDGYVTVTPSIAMTLSSLGFVFGSENRDYAEVSEGMYSGLYYYNTNASSAWTEISDATYGSTYVSGSLSSSLGKNKACYIAFGVKESLLTADKEVSDFDISSASATSDYTWTGKASCSWTNSSNWFGGAVPSSSDEVEIVSSYDNATAYLVDVNYSDGTTSSETVSNGLTGTTNVTNYPKITPSEGKVEVASVTIGSGANVTVDGGALVISGALTVADNSSEGSVYVYNSYDYSSALKFGSTNYTKFTIYRTYETDHVCYIGSATTSGAMKSLNINNSSYDYDGMQNFNASSQTWSDATAFSQTACSALWIESTAHNNASEYTFSQTGEVNYNDMSYSLSEKYNWIYNPYLFSIDLYTKGKGITMGTSLSQTILFRSYDSDNDEYYYSTFNTKIGVGATQSYDGATSTNGRDIAPQQGFCLYAYDTDDCYISFDVDKMTSIYYGEDASLKKADVVPEDILRLSVSSEGYNSDETVIVFRDGDSTTRIFGDSEKFAKDDYSSNVNMIYAIKSDNSAYAIPLYPNADEMVGEKVDLGVRVASGAKSITIKSSNIDEFDDSYDVILHDTEANKSVSLRDVEEYTVDDIEAGATITGRFYVTLNDVSGSTPTSISDVMSYIGVHKSGANEIAVNVTSDIAAEGAIVNVYDLSGRKLDSKSINQSTSILNMPSSKGLYIVEVVSPVAKKSVKINNL